MHFARVIGSLVSTAKVRPLQGYRLLWLQPTDPHGADAGAPLVAVDAGQYGVGEWVYFVTSREASLPLRDSFCPVDATVVGKVDCVDMEGEPPASGTPDGAVGERARRARAAAR